MWHSVLVSSAFDILVARGRIQGKYPTEGRTMTKLQHPIVLIFGAGASRGGLDKGSTVPPPVDRDCFDIANQLVGHGTPKLAKKVLKDVWQLYMRTNGVGLETYYRDLETRAIIGEFAKTSNQPKDWRRRQKDLEELIRRVYVHTTVKDIRASTTEAKESAIHENILGKLEPADTIITFNYDLLIEESLFYVEGLASIFVSYNGVLDEHIVWDK